jgi:hypothetical protein
MGNLTDSADGDGFYAVHYTIKPKKGKAIKGVVNVSAQDGREAFQLAQDMNPDTHLLEDAGLPADCGAEVEWGDVELEED